MAPVLEQQQSCLGPDYDLPDVARTLLGGFAPMGPNTWKFGLLGILGHFSPSAHDPNAKLRQLSSTVLQRVGLTRWGVGFFFAGDP